jgi:hypothetical protein
VRHIQWLVLESHLHTCAKRMLSARNRHDSFIKELLNVIGLSAR